MPPLDTHPFAALPPADLEAKRRAILAKATVDGVTRHDNLDLEDLQDLAAITGILRRKASGPPKAVKTPGASRAKPAKAQIEDLA